MRIPYTLPRFLVRNPAQMSYHGSNPFGNGSINMRQHLVEAPSFYKGIRLRHAASGTETRYHEGVEEPYSIITYSFDVSRTFERESIEDGVLGTSDGKIQMAMRGGVTWDFSRPMINLFGDPNSNIEQVEIGTYNGEVITSWPWLYLPEFVDRTPHGRRSYQATHWGHPFVGFMEIQPNFPWRDFRGKWGYEIAPANDDPLTTSTIVNTYEWELL